jgi:hypothetical protein
MNQRSKAPLRVSLAFVFLLGHVAAAGEPVTSPTRWTLSFKGLGPVKVGMTVQEAEKVLKMKLQEEQVDEPGGCHHARSERELPGVGFLVIDGRVARVDVSKHTYRTASGARVGMTEKEIRRLYPQIKVEPHQYDPAGHYLILTSADQRYGIVFETDGHLVTDLRGGEREPVGYVEGVFELGSNHEASGDAEEVLMKRQTWLVLAVILLGGSGAISEPPPRSIAAEAGLSRPFQEMGAVVASISGKHLRAIQSALPELARWHVTLEGYESIKVFEDSESFTVGFMWREPSIFENGDPPGGQSGLEVEIDKRTNQVRNAHYVK